MSTPELILHLSNTCKYKIADKVNVTEIANQINPYSYEAQKG